MNREIKFRAYQPSAKGDLKWWSWQELMASDLNTIFRYPERYHLMQYTGLKDKNGVEIYEGDICKYRYGRWTYIGKVVFNTHACIFEMRRTEIVGSHGERAIKTQILNHIDKVEVIGNIYDNPEMLEVE